MSCKGNCGKDIRNPPSRQITGYCAECLGLAHKKQLKIELTTEILDKLNLKEKEITSKKLLDKALLEIPESAPSRLPTIAEFNAVGKPPD